MLWIASVSNASLSHDRGLGAPPAAAKGPVSRSTMPTTVHLDSPRLTFAGIPGTPGSVPVDDA